MKVIFGTILFLGLLGCSVGAKSDPRLAHIHSVFVEPVDALSDDVDVAACLPEKMAGMPIVVTPDRTAADAVFRVSAKIRTMDTAKDGALFYFQRHHAELTVTTLNGFELWTDKVPGGRLQRDVACAMAGHLAARLRDAMRKARDGK